MTTSQVKLSRRVRQSGRLSSSASVRAEGEGRHESLNLCLVSRRRPFRPE